MPFSTGAFSGGDGLDVVMTKLHDFAVSSCGWTSNYNTYPYLCINKDDVFVNLLFNETPTVNDLHNSGDVAAPDYTIQGHLSTGFTGASPGLTQYLNQPGSLTTPSQQTCQVSCNDMTPPYANYWLFGPGGSDPDYIHMVIQKANGRFCMLSFGKLDKKGSSYTGGAFLHAIHWNWWFPDGTFPPGEFSSGTGSDILTPNHKWLGDDAANYNLWLGDLGGAAPMASHSVNSTMASLMGRPTLFPPSTLEGFGEPYALWLTGIFFLGTNPTNGVSAMFEVPIFMGNGAGRLYYAGTIPGFRWLSMINRFEGEQVALGSDTWDVFPFKRALPWAPEPYDAKLNTSGPWGFSCKENS